jgi:hypothetical protein
MSATYELDGVTYDVLPAEAGDDVVIFPGYTMAKSCTFMGKRFAPGDPITLAIRNHIRFETLVTSGLVKKV